MNRQDRGRLRAALLISTVLHAGVVGVLWAGGSRGAELPKLRVYAVDIVSPPPRELGEWSPEPSAEPEPEEEVPQAEPEPEPPREAPKPEPQPAVKKEPAPAPAPTKKPDEPKPAPPKETPKPAPKETPKETPKPAPPKETPKPAPSTGQRPDPTSPGGEDLNVKIEGARFVDPAYLANIQRQINRYFRRPAGSRSDVAEVRFWINRDGSVSDIEVVSSGGSFAFRSAAMEAVEQAGINKAFGPLPKEYPADRLLVSFYFRPAS